MVFKSINLKDELVAISKKYPNYLADDANTAFTGIASAHANVLQHFPNITGFKHDAGIAFLQTGTVYSTQQIKQLCIKFRLRFLPSTFYKGNLPFEAIGAVKDFESHFSTVSNEYFIVAPAEFFKLKDRFADPMLFASLGNGQYKLLHQWGADFKPYTPVLKYPLRNFQSGIITAIGIGIAFALLLAAMQVFAYEPTRARQVFNYVSMAIISSMFVFICGLIYHLVTFSDLSEETWNSKYFN